MNRPSAKEEDLRPGNDQLHRLRSSVGSTVLSVNVCFKNQVSDFRNIQMLHRIFLDPNSRYMVYTYVYTCIYMYLIGYIMSPDMTNKSQKEQVSGNGGRCLNAVVGAVQNVGCSATISLVLLVYLIAGRM